MPTIIAHALVPLACKVADRGRKISRRLIAAAMVGAALPDVDVIGFRFGIPYGDQFGHRGATHSLCFALLIGMTGLVLAPFLKSSRASSFLVLSLATASHGLADMLTNGGRGVALFWPFDLTRHFFPIRPIEVSPIGVSRFFAADMMHLLGSELLWLVLPVLLVALSVRALSSGNLARLGSTAD